jgi:hypothetical protein
VAILSLAMSWLALGAPASQPAQASTTDLLSCRFSPAQVFDTQYNISGSTLNVSGLTRPYTSGGQLPANQLDSTDYFKFANSTNGSDPSLSLTQYSSADALKNTLHTWGNFLAIGEDFIFYTGSGFYGTLITTGQGFNYGDSASLAITTNNPSLAQVLAYSSCSSTPLGIGVLRSSIVANPAPGGGSGGETTAESSVAIPQEPAIGLELQALVGGRTDAARLDIIGLHLPEGTNYELSVYRPNRTLASGAVGGNGSFSGLIPIPSDLGEGRHIVLLRATLPSGEVLELHRDFTIGDDGTFTSVGQSSVGAVAVDPRLAYTGVQSSSLPLWALVSMSLGLALILYSLRARRVVELAEAIAPEIVARTPWEILSTPIRVPGIDYLPGSSPHPESASLAEAMRDLDLAFSRMIVSRMDSLQAHFASR